MAEGTAGSSSSDPTANVIALSEAAQRRQDDLRELESAHIREIMALRADCAEQLRVDERDRITLRASFDEQLRAAESSRIDAIRAVDVQAVQRSAEVQVTQATALATQVSVSAETLRTQVAAAASAAATSLAAALVPIQESIADLRRAQYEAQGQKTNVGDARDTSAARIAAIVAALIGLGLLVSVAAVVVTIILATR